MNLQEIEKLAGQYQLALQAELEANESLAAAISNAAAIKNNAIVSAYENEIIDGKNAEIRKAQEQAFLQGHTVYQNSENAVKESKYRASVCKIECQYQETRISLIRAWLYSQSGKEL